MNETDEIDGSHLNNSQKKKKKLDEVPNNELSNLADRLVSAMASNLEKSMQMDDKERLKLEREKEKRLDELPFEE